MAFKLSDEEREYRRKQKQEWRKRNPKWNKEIQDNWRIRNRENMQLTRWVKKSSPPTRPKPETCEICNTKSQIVFDHCHASKKFRGWLCNPCNRALGMFNDDPDRFRRAADYLEQHTHMEDILDTGAAVC